MSKKERWTAEEDALLLELRKQKVPFIKVATLLGRTGDAVRNRHWKVRNRDENNVWLESEVVGVFDIETTNLKANVGFMLSWAMKTSDGRVLGDVIKRREILNGKLDTRILKSLLKAFESVDLISGYYSTRFDVPFVRTRCILQDVEFPTFGTLMHYDMYYTVRNKFQLHRNSLDAATKLFRLDEKGHVGLPLWNKARIGDQKAIDEIYEYNIQDVAISYQLFEKIIPYVKLTRKSI